jgi:hypothetical protein
MGCAGATRAFRRLCPTRARNTTVVSATLLGQREGEGRGRDAVMIMMDQMMKDLMRAR